MRQISRCLFVCLIAINFLAISAGAQTAAGDEWTWMGGAVPSNPQGVYGSLRTPALSNHPGARDSAMTWTDGNGNLWLFGGGGNDSTLLNYGSLNDLWEYSSSTGEWAWMAGSNVLPSCSATTACGSSGVYGTMGTPSPSNIPGGRGSAVVWTDHTGNFWLFGGDGIDSSGNTGSLNDLWEFNPTSEEWTWVGGGNVLPSCSTVKGCGASGGYGAQGTSAPANIPGGRSGGVSWTDSAGNLWLFGGYGFDSAGNQGNLNDLWEFNPTNKQWTWVGGSSTVPASCSPYTTCGQPGVYGSLGSPSPANVPGGRSGAVSWTDGTGNLWLFGGEVNYTYSVGTHGDVNDLWKFSPTTKEWTWMGGNNSPLQSCNGLTLCSPLPVYGLWQTPDAGNIPGAREHAVAWVDGKGNAWLFGGYGLDSIGSLGDLNDIWEFNPETSQWAWMSGSTLQGQNGSEAPQGIASFQSSPAGRNGAVGWTDGNGNLWLIGGYGYSPQEGFVPLLGDLWKFQPYANGADAAFAPTISPGGGAYTSVQLVTLTDSTPGAVIECMVNSNAPPVQYTAPIAVTTSQTIQAIATASGYANSPAVSASYSVNLPTPPAPTFDPQSGTYYGAQTVAISDAASYATIYYTTDGSSPTVNSKIYTGGISVTSTETIQAIAVVSGGAASPVATAAYSILPLPLNYWSLVRGDETNPNLAGIYSQIGLALGQNWPGSRDGAASWTDSSGNFWMFGGSGFDGVGNRGMLNDLWEYMPGAAIQNGEWVWMGGSRTVPCSTVSGTTNCYGQPGVYGTQGQPAAGNLPGGRLDATTWVDANGNLWLFGGYGEDPQGNGAYPLNDLWKFDLSSKQWTWVSGSSDILQPGIYGTLGIAAAGNAPGSRYGATGWTDSAGNLWLFGGYGADSFTGERGRHTWILNDLWKFAPATGLWTWMGGTSLLNCSWDYSGALSCAPVPGIYGTQGTPAAGNYPGNREFAMSWTDANGNFWLFGGSGYDAQGNWGNPNDLWKYNPATNQWAWMSGSSTVPCGPNFQYTEDLCTTPTQVLGTLGVAATGNSPSGGQAEATWIDKQGNLWLFGTSDNWDPTNRFQGPSSDIWTYSPSTNQWAWMGGDSETSNCMIFVPGAPLSTLCQGSQGFLGVGLSIRDTPPSRVDAAKWVDKQGKLWLFGGEIEDTFNPNLYSSFTVLNDLWMYQPAATTLPRAASPIFSLPSGIYVSGGPLTVANGMPTASIHYTTDGSQPGASSNLYSGPLQFSASETVKAIAIAPGYVESNVSSATYTVIPSVPPPTLSLASGTYNSLQTLTMSDSNPYAVILYTIDGSQPGQYSTQYTSPIAISNSETVNAIAYLRGNSVAGGTANYWSSTQSNVSSATYNINLPQAATPTFSLSSGTYTSVQTVTISNTTAGGTIYYTTDGTTPTTQSTVYSSAISVSASETIQAIAVATGYTNSTVASAAYIINLPPPSFTVTGTAVTVTHGATTGNTPTITLTPSGGFTGTVSLSCAITPTAASDPATCSLPNSVTISGESAQTATLTVNTTAATSALNQDRKLFWPSAGGAALACILLIGIPARRRRWQKMLGILVLLFSITGGVFACGGGSNGVGGGGGGGNPGTTAGIYTITVTGTSGAITQKGAVSLTVQ